MVSPEPKSPRTSLPTARLLIPLIAVLPLLALALAIVVNTTARREPLDDESFVAEVEANQPAEPDKPAEPAIEIPAVEPVPTQRTPVEQPAIAESPAIATQPVEPSPVAVAPEPPVVPAAAPPNAAAEPAADTPETKPQLVVQELSKEVYNALSELQAMLESEAWNDAARFVAGIKPETATGLAPYFADKSLLVSLPVAVELALQDEPQLWQTMTEEFSPVARLRIGEAIRSGDAAAIELATVQFAGTAATADAHRWLGDQALVAGWFARAIDQYQRAAENTNDVEAETSPRLRLAAAMLGRNAGQSISNSVQFGDVTMSATDFESLVAEMRRRGKSLAQNLDANGNAAPAVPAPSQFESHTRSRLDGAVGQRPREEGSRRTSALHVPWVDRQIATVVDGQVLYVANRFQVAAYDLASGERKWQRETPPENMPRAQDWTLIPMRPLVVGQRIFVRLLHSTTPFLACLEKSTGKILWTTESSSRDMLVSDPLLIEGELVALSISLEPEQQGLLRYCVFDPLWGQVVKQRDLVRMRGAWVERSCCEVAPLETGLIAVMGGATLVIDRSGQVPWVRSHDVSSIEEDPRSLLQSYQRPLVRAERVYVVQPGVRTVDCLAVATGRRHWSTAIPDVIGLVGLSNDLLVVRTESGLLGLKLSTGEIVWQTDLADLYSFPLLDQERLLVANRERAAESTDEFVVRLSWLNPTDGRQIATTLLADLQGSDPRLGPLVPAGNHLFTFFGNGQYEAKRDVIELIPSAPGELK